MGNIRKWLEDAEKSCGEKIEAIVVGQHYNRKWEEEPREDENILLSREDGLRKLDEDYSEGYGGADCYPMYAWTKSRVYFIGEYDGATGLNFIPRHPIPCEPSFSGDSCI